MLSARQKSYSESCEYYSIPYKLCVPKVEGCVSKQLQMWLLGDAVNTIKIQRRPITLLRKLYY